MDELLKLFLKSIHKTENKHYVLFKDIARFFVIISFASICYETFTGKYQIIDCSVKSFVVFFDMGTIWLCLCYFLLSCFVYFLVRLFFKWVHKRRINKTIVMFEKSRKEFYTYKHKILKEAFVLVEAIFFENSRHKNYLRFKGKFLFLLIIRSIELVKFDQINSVYKIDRSKKTDLQQAKRETSSSKINSFVYFCSDLSAIASFLFFILVYKSVFIPLYILIIGFIISLIVLSFFAVASSIFVNILPYLEIAIAILERIVVSKNRELSTKNPTVTIYI